MTHVLIAGDHFISPDLFSESMCDQLPGVDLQFTSLTLPWPEVPFGTVANVHEASGTEDEMIAATGDSELAVTQLAPFTRRVFEASPSLRWIGVSRGGPVNVDLDAATTAGVRVSFAPGRNAQAAAEYALGLILGVTRRIEVADREMRKGVWRGDFYSFQNAGTEIFGTTVGLVGYGAIGRIVAKVLRVMGAHVIVYDPFVSRESATADGIELVELDALLSTSSIVSLHARLTPESRHMLNAEKLALMPHGAFLVNMARGDLLDYKPIPGMLADGRLGGVALDVYDAEPPAPGWPLLTYDDVIATPHLAGATRQTAHRAALIVAQEAARFLSGMPLNHLANPEVEALQ